jgi:ORF 12 gene product N-terminal
MRDNQRLAVLRTVAVVAVLVGFGGCASDRGTSTTAVPPVSTAAVTAPATPAGRQLAWVLGLLNGGKAPSAQEIERHFSPALLKVAPPGALVQSLGQIAVARPLRLTPIFAQRDRP